MSAIECARLHNELLGRRHSTLQSHGLFALAKQLLIVGLPVIKIFQKVTGECIIFEREKRLGARNVD